MSQHDLVIRGGTIVNGTGSKPFDGDVAIENGRIAAVGSNVGVGSTKERRATGQRSSQER